ncbi:hypothetical protein CsatB_006520 [Cannabis sativa]
MAKTKNAQPSKKPSRGSASASPVTPPAPPAPATGASGLSSAPTKSARKSKTQARKSVANFSSPLVGASPIASSTPGFGDHDESHSSDHTLSKSSSSNGAPNVDKALVTLPTVSSRTRSKVSTPQKPEVVKPKIASKGKKVVSSSSKANNLKENPPSVSSSDSEPKESEEDHDSEGLSDSSEEFVPKDQPAVDDSGSESEEPETDPITTEPVPVPAAVPKKDKGKRPIVSPNPVLPQKRKRPSGISLDNFKPHSHYFCYNDHARDMKFYENRNFTVEKSFNVIAHKPFGVYNMLKERQWVDTLIGLDGYVDRIVKEFYANITDEFPYEDSFMFGKVFVRGHWYSFTVKDVAEALNLPMGIETTDVEFDRQKVFGYLSGDNEIELSDTMHMSQLTYQHAALMRFSLSNWFPCSNPVNVSNELAFFLYKVSIGAKIDLADMIWEQIVSLRKGKKPRLNIIFPHLIYKILSDQEELILDNESIEMPAVRTTFKIPEKPPQGKAAQRKARSASPGLTNDPAAASASTSAPTEMAEFNLRLGRMETSQALLLRKMDNIIKYFRPNDNE